MPLRDVRADGVRFKVTGPWEYAVFTRQVGTSKANVFLWHELRTLSLLPTVLHVFDKACRLFPNRYVYVVDLEARVILKTQEPTYPNDVPEPQGVES